jgi:ribosomal protein S18 acetylase RimI-like enzyme
VWNKIMEQVIDVREMTLDDVDAVIEIYDKVYDSKYISFGELAAGLATEPGVTAENALELFREEVVGLVSKSEAGSSEVRQFVGIVDGVVAGFALANLETTDAGHIECWLNDLGVLSNYRGRRIGSQLVDKVIEWGTKHNAKYFLLESGMDNELAHRLFEKKEFHPLAVVFYREA